MMAEGDLFRQAALDRLASPEQLHTLMKVTDAKGWLALLGCGVLLASALCWGVFGSVPTKLQASGILIHSAGLADVVGLGAGQVTSIDVDAGDFVRKGQVIAHLGQPEIEQELAGLRARLTELQLGYETSKQLESQDVRLRAAATAQEQSTLKSTIAATEQRKRELEQKLEAQKRLYEKGLVTKEALLGTQEALRTAESSMSGMHANIQQVAVTRLSAVRANEVELRQNRSQIAETERGIAALQQRLEQNSRVQSPYDGRVVELRAMAGDVIGPGQPIVNLERTAERGELEALLYIDSRHGKLIKPGMRVEISPSLTRRERYGVLLGQVRAVEDFPSTRRGMLRVLHNEQLVDTFLAETQGVPTAMRASLRIDRSTPSGYAWSSRRGPSLQLSSGTRCSAAVITAAQSPISLLFPTFEAGF
jgi:HlyD family secretion protein